MIRALLAAALLAFLSACAPESGAMTAGPGHPVTGSPLANAVRVGAVSGGTSTNSFAYADVSDVDLQDALQQSLAGSGLYTRGDARYALSLAFASERSVEGTTARVHVQIQYTLVEFATNRTLLNETIDTRSNDADAGLSYKAAQEQAIKRNIAQMMAKLDAWGG